MNNTTVPPKHEYQQKDLNLYYAACEILVAVFAVLGNALVIHVFRKERRLRRRTNYYIVSLAAADFLVGLLGIPFALLSSIGKPHNLHGCLFTVSLLVVLCTISIFSLVAVSVDRYWAILLPMGYSRNVRTKTALVIISICWFAGTMVGFLPLLGWHKEPGDDYCFFLNVMQPNYLVFLYFGTIVTPALLLAAFYTHIYQVVLKQLRNIVTMHPEKGSIRGDLSSGMIRVLGVQQTNEVKATQNLAIIVLFFMICWFPLYTINCIIAFNPDFYVPSTVMLCSIILSHLNSAGNPLLYAYHLKDFRAALKNFFLTLFDRASYCEPVSKNARDYNSKLRKRACSASTCNLTSLGNKPSGRVKLIVPEKISTIVKSSAVVAAATTGEINHAIWNISENSVSSSDSLKSVDSLNHEKCCLMIRPATPYRPRSSSDFNSIIKGSAQDDESDDGFNEEETLPYHDYGLEDDCKLETCFTKSPKHIPSSHKRSLSNSSPQISIGLYYVERDRISLQGYSSNGFEPNRAKSGANGSRKGLDTLQVVDIFRNERHLNRSLSDSCRIGS